TRRERPGEIGGDPAESEPAAGGRHFGTSDRQRLLEDEVDESTGAAVAVQDRRRPSQVLDALEADGLPNAPAERTQPVAPQIVEANDESAREDRPAVVHRRHAYGVVVRIPDVGRQA